MHERTYQPPLEVRVPFKPEPLRAKENYLLKGKYSVQLIRKPYTLALEAKETSELIENLWEVLFHACSRDEGLLAEYKGKINLEKVALLVDYLILVRDQTEIVAFASGSFINPSLFYLSATMVLPQLQLTGIGSILTAFLCYVAFKDNRIRGLEDPFFVCRTSNRKAASSLLQAFKNGILSTEQTDDENTGKLIRETADYLHCELEEASGIIKNVYPPGLPKGVEITDERVNKAFSKLGPNDALFVLGQTKQQLIALLVKKTMIKFSETCRPAAYLN